MSSGSNSSSNDGDQKARKLVHDQAEEDENGEINKKNRNDDDDDDDADEDEEDRNEYIKDGFVVDDDDYGTEEDEDTTNKKRKVDDESSSGKKPKKRIHLRLRKVQQWDVLNQDDKDLILEDKGKLPAAMMPPNKKQQDDSIINNDDDDDGFIVDDDNYNDDGGEMLFVGPGNDDHGNSGGVTAAQLKEHQEIFGTGYLDFLQTQERRVSGGGGSSKSPYSDEKELLGKRPFLERNVSVDLSVATAGDSDSDSEDDEEAKEVAKARSGRKQEKRRSQLLRAFEPSQLTENFLTERDEEIQTVDIPERLFVAEKDQPPLIMVEEERHRREKALWIMTKLSTGSPEIIELLAIPPHASNQDNEDDSSEDGEIQEEGEEEDPTPQEVQPANRQTDGRELIIESILQALQLIHKEKLEPAFIKRYRKDVVRSPVIRENLFEILQHEKEWYNMIPVRSKVESLLRRFESDTTSAIASAADNDVVAEKICWDKVWNQQNMSSYLSGLTDIGHILDVNGYINLLMDGNKKILTTLCNDENQRSRRRVLGRDLHSSHVSEGLRSICYRYLMPPQQIGSLLESGDRNDDGDRLAGPPSTPSDTISTTARRGCRYVAAMELANEPRTKKYLRGMFQRHALLTTRPTKKGLDNIDPFHENYGLHLIRNKPIKEHFYSATTETNDSARARLKSPEERKDYDLKRINGARDSCLQYLRLQKAEQDGDITIHIHLPFKQGEDSFKDDWYKNDELYAPKSREKQDVSVIMGMLQNVYMSPDQDDPDGWNKERRKVLDYAMIDILLPQFETEIRRELREGAINVGVLDAAKNLQKVAMEGPYRPTHFVDSNRFLDPTGDLPLLGIFCSPESGGTFLASVTKDGILSNHLAIPPGTRGGVGDQKQQDTIIEFLCRERPTAVLIGTSGGVASRYLVKRMSELVNEAQKRWRKNGYNEDIDDEWYCNVDLVDDSVAQLFGRSPRAKKEFPDNSANLNCAIAIARYAQSPVTELTYAWSVASDTGTFGSEILYMNTHPMQQLLPRTLLLRHYEQTLCEVVAEVGVDINKACSYDHMAGLLSFVPGLGPRKSANLRRTVRQYGSRLNQIPNRRSLMKKRLMGPTVYTNSSAFFKFPELVLDGTRLHPEVYKWATKFAAEALDRKVVDGPFKEQAGIDAVLDAMENSRMEVDRLYMAAVNEWKRKNGRGSKFPDWDPKLETSADQWHDKITEIDSDAKADLIEKKELGRWHSQLQMIKWEFRLPFADPRKPMERLSGDRLFRLITGESDQSIRPGKEITGKVILNNRYGSRVKLDCQISAFVPIRYLADRYVERVDDIVPVNTAITALIRQVKKEHLAVDLTLKKDDFRRILSSWGRPNSLPRLDTWFDFNTSRKIEDKQTAERAARLEGIHPCNRKTTKMGGDGQEETGGHEGQAVARRACTHPAFRNANHNEVEKELKKGGRSMVGEALIRPSTTSADSLSLSWVVREGSIKVVEIKESGKTTPTSIGKTLKIKNEVYGSIDEIFARYISPMNDFVEELTNHRKFVKLPEDELDARLVQEKRANPGGSFYNICWAARPGYATLHFVFNSAPKQYPIAITPHGFGFGTKTYSSMDKLLNAFKQNPRRAPT